MRPIDGDTKKCNRSDGSKTFFTSSFVRPVLWFATGSFGVNKSAYSLLDVIHSEFETKGRI